MAAIAAHPDRFARFSHDTRRALLRRFPHYVVFRTTPAIGVVALVHAKRRPAYWRNRLPPVT